MKVKLYKRLANLLMCLEKDTLLKECHQTELDKLCKQYLPHGSGFDCGTELESESTPNKLIFGTSFHHMNDTGYYVRWTCHRVIITPNLALDYDINVTGPNYRDIKQYIAEMFSEILDEEI